ncbi:hypothetical protein FB192DRAFT_1387004 [Mucor lusitanicus]|uniref:Uncharacterized protein n=1 Tax=Mucor circinelloides f. lusitanicus TaxID=29924 RepID=A0A8H4BDK5_MUCCL|nr:hypothetical protein FB192DRAFT_1387004 [Mucor lusitanicus]
MAEIKSSRNRPRFHPDDDTSDPPPIFGNFFEGWSGFFSNNHNDQDKQTTISGQQQDYENDRYSTLSSQTASTSTRRSSILYDDSIPPRRKNSVQLGRQVMSELLENDNVSNAIQILQQALDHLQMTRTEGENKEDVSKIYSQIIKSLCDPSIARIVDEMSKHDGKVPDIQESVLWRLFTKVVESGYVLEREAHLAVVNTLVDRNHKSLALQAMYALPRREWDTACYRTAVLLHLLQDPKQSQEAQGLLSDYGKPYLEIANPIAPNDLPPIRMEMPLMHEVTEQDQFQLWMFYQSALSASDEEWHNTKLAYEKLRKENMEALQHHEEEEGDGIKDWAMSQLQIETKKQQVDRISTDNDNTMIFVAVNNSQFEYGWQVYEAMGDAVNDATPCIVMHLCWVAFRQIPIADISRRTYWENRAWSVYSRFMCSEYLHPEENEAPGFLHDILSIAANSPEIVIDKKARYTKAMSIYNLLVRLHFDKLLCDDRVLEPVLCTLLSECKGSPANIVMMSNKGFEIWNRKLEIAHSSVRTSYSMLWGLLVLALKSGQADLDKVLVQLLEKDMNDVPSSLIAILQTLHDQTMCDGCYFFDYMFRRIEFTDSSKETSAILVDKFGFVYDGERSQGFLDQQPVWRTNINELQATSISMAVKMGVAKQEELVPKQMYYSTKKAKALVRHCLKRSELKSFT